MTRRRPGKIRTTASGNVARQGKTSSPDSQNKTGPEQADHYRRFSGKLRQWFRKQGRSLPWRETRDPYRVLISELMLQQTQVSRVLDFYRAFLERFPTLSHVARAKEQHVLDAWKGLGYYARARNLHKLARHVHTSSGELPSSVEELRALPGIGAYTAGAVSSFAFEQRAALVDTNVARVLKRVFAPDANHKSGKGAKQLWMIAEEALPRTGKASWTHNQAVMELGALVCTARIAHCSTCPVSTLCATHARGGVEKIG